MATSFGAYNASGATDITSRYELDNVKEITIMMLVELN